MAKKQLTDRQKLFLQFLFSDEAQGSPAKAKVLAGYSDTYPTSDLCKSLEDEILDATKAFLSRSAPKAAISLVEVLTNPTELGIKEKIVVAKDVLDRVGLSKTEKVEVKGGGLFYLHRKDDEID